MPKVRGTKHDRLMVTRYNPMAKVLRFIFVTLLALGMAVGGYYGGVINSVDEIQALSLQRDTLENSLADAEHTISSLSQRVSILEKGGEVDRKATEGVRQTVIELKAQIATLEEEVSFYKGIMAPSGNDKGLRVSKIDVTREENSNRYRYSIMLTQVRSEEHTSELQSRPHLVCRLLLEKKNKLATKLDGTDLQALRLRHHHPHHQQQPWPHYRPATAFYFVQPPAPHPPRLAVIFLSFPP